MKHICVSFLLIPIVYISYILKGSTHGVMVDIIGNGHSNQSSNPGWGYSYFSSYL